MNNIIEDKELGKLILRINPRARHFVFRTKPDAIYVTIPPGATARELQTSIEKVKDKLLKAKQKTASKYVPINLNYRIDAEYFKLRLMNGTHPKFLAKSELGKLDVICPPGADFSDEGLQTWLRKVIVEALRRNAKIILPPRLYMLSTQHNLPYRAVKINSSRGRWGSCSAKKDINLSCFLMLLPKHLIDYVLLHELAHTREMNHSDKFWKLLNSLTEQQAEALRRELKNFKTDL
ncbi:M48 family peptidase [Bacteroides sp. 214]|uniref:YgjP family zinc-dependent metalloprotease n=1 Tax=Bacteroides sp. 214 TaxID=2302935 RepID=UPI0013CFD418|nr:SprT family zinc-dependent metalloprotease [Bacteroides sp. 214]NDW12062.1 M48 family peptidase [Bacteroides sp. 214]